MATNKLLHGVREVEALREILLNAASGDADADQSDADVHLLVPQSVTLDDVTITDELLRAHLVVQQHAARAPLPRRFTSLCGLHGTFEEAAQEVDEY